MTAIAGSALLLLTASIGAAELYTSVPMRSGGAATFYVAGHVEGAGEMDFMVDTGSGYVTINEVTLAALQRENRTRYSRDLRGVLADGSELNVPVYVIQRLTIGGRCHLENIEAAVFPGATRQILGLSALRKAAPFVFSFEPPSLQLSNCPGDATLAEVGATQLITVPAGSAGKPTNRPSVNPE